MAKAEERRTHETTEAKLAWLEQLRDDARHAGSESAVAKQHDAGKLLARERAERLCDPGSFVELDRYVRHREPNFGMLERRPYGDAVVTGYGTIFGRKVFLFSQDFTVFGGSLSEVFAEKICKVMDLALKFGCPVIGINDSGGARIQEGVVSLAGYAEIFWRNVQCSGVIPQVSLVMGPLRRRRGLLARDHRLRVHGRGLVVHVHHRPRRREDRHRGGGQLRGARRRGDARVEVGRRALRRSRTTSRVSTTRATSSRSCRRTTSSRRRTRSRPIPRDRESPELDTFVPDNPNKPYDMKEVIAAVFDDGEFLEVHERYAENIVCGFARLGGHVVGVVGNQPRALAGVLDIDSSTKAGRFVRTCDAFNIPLVTFVDVPGFLPGTEQEWGGIIRHGAKLLYAYAEATVPKLAVITRKAYGGAYDVMSSKHIRADFNFAWPTAEVAVMGPEGAVNIIFRKELAEADDPESRRAELIADYKERFANPWSAAERGYVDDVIEPRRTRPVLIDALETSLTKREPRPKRKHGNIPL